MTMANAELQQKVTAAGLARDVVVVGVELFDKGHFLGVQAKWQGGREHCVKERLAVPGTPSQSEIDECIGALADWARANHL